MNEYNNKSKILLFWERERYYVFKLETLSHQLGLPMSNVWSMVERPYGTTLNNQPCVFIRFQDHKALSSNTAELEDFRDFVDQVLQGETTGSKRMKGLAEELSRKLNPQLV